MNKPSRGNRSSRATDAQEQADTEKTPSASLFTSNTFKFLRDLRQHNDRDWFRENKSRYEEHVRQPALELIRQIERPLAQVAPFFPAIAKPVGGSLIRIYRDTRFSKDKTPFKPNIGIHFRHEAGKDIHSPAFYIHVEPEACFIAAGCWRPPTEALRAIRQAILQQSARWRRVRKNKRINEKYSWEGERLKTAPRGIAKDHPLIEDLRRRDFIVMAQLSQTQMMAGNLPVDLTNAFAVTRPLMRFLCESVGVAFD